MLKALCAKMTKTGKIAYFYPRKAYKKARWKKRDARFESWCYRQ